MAAHAATPDALFDSVDSLDEVDEFDQPSSLDLTSSAPKATSSQATIYDDVPIDAIRRFVSIYEKVKENYVEPVDDNELFENALHGLLSQLDPYSDYLDSHTYAALMDFTEGEVAQTGLTVRASTEADASWQIDRVEAGSPAARAGLHEGMLLYKIDGKNTRSLNAHDIEQLLRGAVGTTVELSVSELGRHPVIIKVVRATPEDNVVKALGYPNGILVLKVNAFQAQTASQIDQAIIDYQKNNILKAVLLDLRDNPGGLLSAAVEVADLFLDQGLIVYTKGRGEPEQRYQALPPARYASVPLGVLVNHYSASAAEVLAGAFQDHQRATIMGENSYGKGSVQKLWPIADGHAIKLTVSRYYTPKGRLIEGKGIQPDIMIKDQALKDHIDITLDSSVATFGKMLNLP
ncbi:S41 family peptidase [Alkanindiges sp. WGS2144]|uniref:S41 family peptidase n=1 Tax=Alkanindiges sp. WGS2144 TaxID=3366808 RepID=UPI0037535F8F